MQVHYKATLDSSSKMLDGLPMQLAVGSKVTCKLREVDELKYGCTDAERRWYETEVVPNIKDK